MPENEAPQSFQEYKATRTAAPVAVAEETPAPADTVETVETPKTEETPAAEEGEKKKGGWQRRIEKLEREKAELEKKVSEPAKPLAQDAGAAKPETKTAEGRPEKPKLENFDSYDKWEDAKDEYLEKLADWKVDQREKQRSEQAKQAQAQQQQQAVLKTFNERLAAAKARITDFDDVVQGAIADHDVQVSPAMSEAITESEHGPDVVYYLAKHPDEALRISKLSPLAAAREIGKIEAKVTPEAEPEKTATKVSKAPAPVKPVGKTASTAKTLDDVGDDYQAHKAIRLKQLQRN
jgi:plasmid stabilization system protein ParE